jgi:hypothetical protein
VQTDGDGVAPTPLWERPMHIRRGGRRGTTEPPTSLYDAGTRQRRPEGGDGSLSGEIHLATTRTFGCARISVMSRAERDVVGGGVVQRVRSGILMVRARPR